MVTIRAQKIAGIARGYPALVVEGDEDAEVLLVGWGSTYGSFRSTLIQGQSEGLPLALLHLRHLNPLPDDLGKLLRKFKHVLVAELNSGQLCQLLRAQYLVDARSISQCNGQPFTPSYLINAIKADVCHESANV